MIGRLLGFGVILVVVAAACTSSASDSVQPDRRDALKVVATTSIVGDVVKAVGGETIELSVLLPIGADPHGFQPTPQDVTKVAEADVVFMNGVGLEGFLESLIRNAGGHAETVSVSEHVPWLAFEGQGEQAGGHAHDQGADPHVWFDVTNVVMWVQAVERKLSELDPANAETYAANAAAYAATLEELHGWIEEQVAQIPGANQKLVTDHTALVYFARRYGFEQVGAVVPGYSTLAEPSAQELAGLEDAIRALGVKAIFVGNTVNPNLAQRVADDTGTRLVFLYTGSLGEPGGPADTYVDMMRYDVSAIVDALK